MSARLVVDSSAICSLCFDDEANAATEPLLEQLALGDVWVPALFLWEVANVLLMAERRQRLSQAQRVEALRTIEDLGLMVDRPDPGVIWHDGIQLASQTGLTSYDAAYLELAMRLGTPLATQDKALQQACLKLGVNILAC